MGREESKEAGMMVDNARYYADLGREREEKADTSDEYETEVIEREVQVEEKGQRG